MGPRQDTRVCGWVGVSEHGSPSETATGVEGQKLSLSGCPLQPQRSPPSLQPVNTKSGKKAHITSSLRVKDRPPCEWLLRALLFNHIAGDYTLCHLRADLAFLSTQAQNIKYQLPNQPANTHAVGITGHPRNKAGADVPLRPPNQDLDSRFHSSAAAAQDLREQKVPDVLLL